jgi:lipoprotein-anchoring transpeptidase ErfK/SrfK
MKQRTALDIFLSVIFFTICFFVFFYISKNYQGALGGLFWIDKQSEIESQDAVVVNFYRPILARGVEPKINIYPEIEFEYSWSESGEKMVITPKEAWDLNKNYFVSVKDLKNIFLVNRDISFSFATRNYPEVSNFYPADRAQDVVIDIEDPLKVTFDKSLDNFNVKFETNPKRMIGYNLSEDKKTVSFIFQDGYEKGEEYQVGVYVKGKDEGQSDYHKIYESSFKAELPESPEWSNDFEKRLDQARRFTRAQVKNGKYIDINLGVQVMTIFENGKALESFLISSGKRGMDTPKGQFKVSNKHPRPWSKAYGLYMPYWMAIMPSGKFGIHELPEWPGGYKEGQDHLGTPVSHGCVRLGVGAAKRVYEWAEIGTPIVIY